MRGRNAIMSVCDESDHHGAPNQLLVAWPFTRSFSAKTVQAGSTRLEPCGHSMCRRLRILCAVVDDLSFEDAEIDEPMPKLFDDGLFNQRS